MCENKLPHETGKFRFIVTIIIYEIPQFIGALRPEKQDNTPPALLWTSKNDHGRIISTNSVGARPMVGLQTLDLPIEVRILCPQPN